MKPIRIGISGKMSSGKSLIAKFLVKNCGFRELSFAAALKSIAADLFDVHGKSAIERSVLQQLGSRMREVDPNVWLIYVIKRIPLSKHAVVSDVRYPNEYVTLKGLGFTLIRMVMSPEEQERLLSINYVGEPLPVLLLNRNDYSETALDDYKFDYYIYNNREDTLDDVYKQTADIIKAIKKAQNG